MEIRQKPGAMQRWRQVITACLVLVTVIYWQTSGEANTRMYERRELPTIPLDELVKREKSLLAREKMVADRAREVNTRVVADRAINDDHESKNKRTVDEHESSMNSTQCWAKNDVPTSYGWQYGNTKVGLTLDMFLRSRTNVGDVGRMRNLICKLNRGEAIKGVALGASVTNGNGIQPMQHPKPTYPAHFSNWLNLAFPTNGSAQHEVETVAFESCDICYITKFARNLFSAQRKDVDIIIIEFSVNDLVYGYGSTTAKTEGQPFAEEYWDFVKCTEALVRFFLDLNPHVCIVFLEHMQVRIPSYFNTAQELHSLVANAYSIPVVSVKNAIFPSLEQWASSPVPLFDKNTLRFEDRFNSKGKDKYHAFWTDDGVHPSVLGHKLLADLLAFPIVAEASTPGVRQRAVKAQAPPTAPISVQQPSELQELVSFVHVVSSWRYGNGFQAQGNDLKHAKAANEGDWTYSQTGHKSPDNKAWGCVECDGFLVLKVAMKEALPTAAVVTLGYKRSYEGFGNFTVFTTTVDPATSLRKNEAPEGQKVLLSGLWRKRASLWVDSQIASLPSGPAPTFFVAVLPASPGKIILQDISVRLSSKK